LLTQARCSSSPAECLLQSSSALVDGATAVPHSCRAFRAPPWPPLCHAVAQLPDRRRRSVTGAMASRLQALPSLAVCSCGPAPVSWGVRGPRSRLSASPGRDWAELESILCSASAIGDEERVSTQSVGEIRLVAGLVSL
jgi:hypothetical protein